jgi:putative transcriptional regulator
MGLVVNRTHPSLTGGDIFDELKVEFESPAAKIPIHIGGPVHAGEVFILHGPPFGWEGCLNITPSLALSNTMDILQAIATGSGPESFMLMLGCAGWGPGQLESELQQNVWLTSPVYEDIIFELPVEQRWEAALRKIGVDPAALTETAGHA